MNHIGEKIKELRIKNNMTQEKLAERLGVSFQTVSKWETKTTSPDLSLIVPLARLFKTTTDELFFYSESSDALRQKELDEEYCKTFTSGDLDKRHMISEQAVKEFPSDMRWLGRLAWTQALCSFKYGDEAEYIRQQEEAIKKFATVIENTDDEAVRADSICGITQYLSFRGRNEEAEEYAKLYPDWYMNKDEVLLNCLTGERRTVHYQNMLGRALHNLLELLGSNTAFACDAAEKIIEAMIPDGRYLYCHLFLAKIYRSRAVFGMEASDRGKAAEMLKLSFYHAHKFDEFMSGGRAAGSKPFFDRIEHNPEEDYSRTGTSTQAEDILEFVLNRPLLAPLYEEAKRLAGE